MTDWYEEYEHVLHEYDPDLKWDEFLDNKRREHIDDYNNFIHSKEWAYKRDIILKRDKHLCQVCKKNKATQVHHLRYERLYVERPLDLISLCYDCHMNIHEDKFKESYANCMLSMDMNADYNKSFIRLKKYLRIRDSKSGVDWLDSDQIKQREQELNAYLQNKKYEDVDIFAD